MTTTTLHLTAVPPFRLSSVAGSHGWIQLLPFGYDPENAVLSTITHLADGRVVAVQITAQDEEVAVIVQADLTAEETAQIRTQVTWMLGLEQDYSAFYARAAQEPALSHMVDGARGRILRSATVFEDAVKMILTTNTSWGGTKRMVAALVNTYGTPLPSDTARHAFPTPLQLADAGAVALREAGLGYRAPFVAMLAQDVVAGSLDLEALKTSDHPTDALRKELLAIKGIGAYASAGLLMLLGRYDAVPIDSYAKSMVSREWHNGAAVGAEEVEAAFERWGAWRGLAYWFWEWGKDR